MTFRRSLLPLIGLATGVAIFLLDLTQPLGTVVAILYVGPILVGMWTPQPYFALVAAAGATALTWMDVPLSPLGGDLPIAFTNRLMVVTALWVTALLVVQRRATLDALAERTQRAQLYLDVAGVMIVVLDRRQRILLLNRKARQLLHVTGEDLTGRDWFDTFVPERVRDGVRETHKKFLRGDPSVEAIDYPVLTRRGDERIIHWHRAIVRDAAGQVIGTIGSGEDTTPTRVAEAALRRSIKDLQDIKYAIDQAAIVAITDVHGRITYANDKFCEISKYSRGELLGQDHRIINSGYHSKEFIRDLWRTIARGQVWRGEIKNRAKDGSPYWVDTTIVPFLDERGKPYQYMAIRSDITERKRQEERMREQAALTRLGEMAAVVAHEVKNPLAGIRGALQIIATRMPPDSRDRSVIGDILARVDSLNNIVQDLLLFARPRAPRADKVALGALLASTVELLKKDPAFARIETSLGGEDPVVEADTEQLQTVFMNLLLNAAQAVGGAGRVEVMLNQRDGWCHVTIRDHGPGIPPEVRERIFEPFFTTKHRGTGLGLPTARRVVELHRGKIDVEMPSDGGTAVTVSLPVERN
ncbi:MAG TPA: PAS domain S-box protein [Vicinamibacterales bacterium]|nr:PAS domain S-box protein [Vicinamibacterales bacterium]